MGIRYRKSFKAGPVRINLSKTGIGYSTGTKGMRYTKKANGNTQTTFSIPGTGISYTDEHSSRGKRHSASKEVRYNTSSIETPVAKNIVLSYFLAVLLGVFGVHRLYLGKKKSGIAMLLITLLTFGAGAPITLCWTFVDLFFIPTWIRLNNAPINLQEAGISTPFEQSTSENIFKKTFLADELKKLAQLRDNGIITDTEFQKQKDKFLNN